MSSTAGAAPSTSAASASGSASRPSRKRIQNSKLGSPSGRARRPAGRLGRAVLDLLGDAHAGQRAAVEHVGRLVGRREPRRLVEHVRAARRPAPRSPKVASRRTISLARPGRGRASPVATRRPARTTSVRISAGPTSAGPQEVRRRHQRVGERHARPAARAGPRRACSRRWGCRRARSSGRSASARVACSPSRLDGGVGVEEVLGHRRHRPARVGAAGEDLNYPRGNDSSAR